MATEADLSSLFIAMEADLSFLISTTMAAVFTPDAVTQPALQRSASPPALQGAVSKSAGTPDSIVFWSIWNLLIHSMHVIQLIVSNSSVHMILFFSFFFNVFDLGYDILIKHYNHLVCLTLWGLRVFGALEKF